MATLYISPPGKQTVELPPPMKPFDLFVYGTLMNPSVFRAVLGRRLVDRPEDADDVESFHPRQAVLDDYKKVSPDNTYLYAVPDRHGRIRGYLIGPLPGECMSALLRFEGRNYVRKQVTVTTKDGPVRAVAFVGHLKNMKHSFGYDFRDALKQEILLDRKIDAALLAAERERLNTTESLTRRAVRELHARTIRDIVRRHFEAGGISDYTIRHSITDRPIRDFTRITEDPAAVALAPNYLRMAVRQVIFNEVEENIRRDLRYEIDHLNQPGEYYQRAVSCLAALRILNAQARKLDALAGQCLAERGFPGSHLVDFIRWAVAASDGLYSAESAKREIDYVKSHTASGQIPLGAELEFSNIGHDVIRDRQGARQRDLVYDGFFYFYDFALDELTWKLGGHVDDHREKASRRPRRGFFEIALGSLSIEANISKPITADPWLLNQFIREARRFYQIKPHSVHISLQLPAGGRPDRNRLLPPNVMKCLFAIAGDPAVGRDGVCRVGRLVTDEIMTAGPIPGMMFAEITRRRSAEEEPAFAGRAPGRYVQQFKFLRLSPRLNYEPIAMALKGVQLRFSPGEFLKPDQYKNSVAHRRLYEDLLAWGRRPEPIGPGEVDDFLNGVREGLMSEHRSRPAHGEAYIAWSLGELRGMLDAFNTMTSGSGRP